MKWILVYAIIITIILVGFLLSDSIGFVHLYKIIDGYGQFSRLPAYTITVEGDIASIIDWSDSTQIYYTTTNDLDIMLEYADLSQPVATYGDTAIGRDPSALIEYLDSAMVLPCTSYKYLDSATVYTEEIE